MQLPPFYRKKGLKNQGQAMIEFCVIFPVILLFFFAAIEIASLFVDYHNLLTIAHVTAKNICMECGWLNSQAYRARCIQKTVLDMKSVASTMFRNFTPENQCYIQGSLYLFVDRQNGNDPTSDIVPTQASWATEDSCPPSNYQMANWSTIANEGFYYSDITYKRGTTTKVFNITQFGVLGVAEVYYRRGYYTPLWALLRVIKPTQDFYATAIF